MIKNKFRITIAVYNAEKYIPRCLNSLINQTYNNWTAIIVDDASTDNTGKIAESSLRKIVGLELYIIITMLEM